jgi:hypothetical protein
MRSPFRSGLVAGLLCLGTFLPSIALADWASEVLLPPGEKPVALFDGRGLSGWEGLVGKHWTVEDGTIRGANTGDVPASTYLFTKGKHRDFRLLLEVKQTRGDHFSPMHSAVAVLGEVQEDKGGPYGFKGPLVMFCNDWGVWDANRRNRVFPPRYPTNWRHPAEIVGDWNRIEVLVRGDHLRAVVNGQLVMDYYEEPGILKSSPIGLQLHANDRPQEFRFRGLVLVDDPSDPLVTAKSPAK